MEKIIEIYKKQLLESFGQRVENGKCVFCGKELLNDDYCDCSESALINRFYKRAHKKIISVKEYEVIGETIENVQKKYISRVITPRRFDGMTFKSYLTENDSQKRALEGVVEYYNNAFKNYLTGMNLFLFGNYGTGKTMLMSILCRALAKDYLFACRFVNVVDFMNEILDCFNSKNTKTTMEILNRYKKSEFLFLDDIDKIKPSEYARTIVYSLVNYRTENELPTIISANHSPEELDLKYFEEAIVSRLVDVNNSKVINFSHHNKRLGG